MWGSMSTLCCLLSALLSLIRQVEPLSLRSPSSFFQGQNRFPSQTLTSQVDRSWSLWILQSTSNNNSAEAVSTGKEELDRRKTDPHDSVKTKQKHRKWDEYYKDLVAFHKVYGHCRVPQKYPKLGPWVSRQRTRYRLLKDEKKSSLTPERVKLLEDIGFEWFAIMTWERHFAELKEFRKSKGHCMVPTKYAENRPLGWWVCTQRSLYRKEALTEDQIAKLNSIGFVWRTRFLRWEDRLEELKAYRAVHGHILVPKLDPDNPPLGRWLANQRTQYRYWKENKPSHLTQDQVDELEAVGFEWDDDRGYGPRIEVWNKRVKELDEFRSVHGHCRVPSRYPENPQLGHWCQSQRRQFNLFKNNKPSLLTADRIRELKAVGFSFRGSKEQEFDTRIEELKAFQAQHGHARVPGKYKENPSLGKWVSMLREQYGKRQQGKTTRLLTPARIQELEDVGFEWRLRAPRRQKQ